MAGKIANVNERGKPTEIEETASILPGTPCAPTESYVGRATLERPQTEWKTLETLAAEQSSTPPPETSPQVRKSGRVLLWIFVISSVFLATHKGEFWPFSIYPMFSQAGRPWHRAIMRDYTAVPDSLLWKESRIEDLQGEPFALEDYGIEGPDIAKYIAINRNWDARGRNNFRKVFLKHLHGRRLAALRLDGTAMGDSVRVVATPVLLITADTTVLNPKLGSP